MLPAGQRDKPRTRNGWGSALPTPPYEPVPGTEPSLATPIAAMYTYRRGEERATHMLLDAIRWQNVRHFPMFPALRSAY